MSGSLRGSSASIFLKVSGIVVSLVLAIFLARTLGPAGYGEYSYALALMMLLAIPAQLGLPSLLVREIATALADGRWSRVRGIWRWSFTVAMTLCVLLVAGGAVATVMLAERFSTMSVHTFAWALLLLPLTAFANLNSAALRGLQCLPLGLVPEHLLRSAALICLLAVWYTTDTEFAPSDAMMLHVIAGLVAFALTTYWLIHAFPEPVRGASPSYDSRRWLASTLPLAVIAAAHVINNRTDTVMLGIFTDPTQVGVYQVAVAGAGLVIVGLGAVNLVIAPRLADLHFRGKGVELQRLVTKSGRLMMALALPVAAVLTVLGSELVVWVFGADFGAAAVPLAVLAIGQLLNAYFGPAGMLLMMTNHERTTATALLSAATLNVLLNAMLIPAYGILGAAVATTMSLVVWNVLLWHAARRLLGVDTAASARIKI